jgi:heme exporter protein B
VAALAVLQRDWRGEWRTRAALNSALLFAVAAPVALSFSLARQRLEPEALAGCLWSVLLFAALVGLPRAFVKEEESGTALQLRLSAPPDAVLWGKAAFNLGLLVATQLAAVPIFVLLLDANIASPLVLLGALILGDIGLAVASTLLGAMASAAHARGALFCAIAVPILLPLLVVAASATSVAFGARVDGGAAGALQILLAYDAALCAAAWMLFAFVWK